MNAVTMSRHAQVRSQQRGIPKMVIDLLLEFGARERASPGAQKMFFDKRARKRLRAYAGDMVDTLTQYLDVYIVVSDHDHVITTAHRLERIKRH